MTSHVEEKQLKETVGFKAGKRQNAGMFGREERQQNNRRKPEEKRDRLRQREGETTVIIVSLTVDSTVKLHHTKKDHNDTNEIKRRANIFIQEMKGLLKNNKSVSTSLSEESLTIHKSAIKCQRSQYERKCFSSNSSQTKCSELLCTFILYLHLSKVWGQ